jgi:hypothetical protein
MNKSSQKGMKIGMDVPFELTDIHYINYIIFE